MEWNGIGWERKKGKRLLAKEELSLAGVLLSERISLVLVRSLLS
jgi:hypothetical protein